MKQENILITGATGSFGKHFVKNCLLNKNYKKIIIFSRDELKQYEMKNELTKITTRNKKNIAKLRFFLGDIRDKDRLDYAMNNVDTVIHAAALKQVPAAEYNPFEFVKTNIIGSQNVIESAIKNNIKKVLALSTDKASSPTNLYGATKLTADKMFISANNYRGLNETKFSVVRYGNVMGSRGSVIPLFINQIKTNKNITITSPDMTRFLMSLDNAVDLVDYAFNNCSNGDMFIQKAPSCSIQTLAESLIEIFDSSSKIINIGIRHGEKMHETLVTSEEMIRADETADYFKIKPDSRDLNYENYFSKGEMEKMPEAYSSNNTSILDKNSVINLLMSLPLVKDELKSY